MPADIFFHRNSNHTECSVHLFIFNIFLLKLSQIMYQFFDAQARGYVIQLYLKDCSPGFASVLVSGL